MGFPGVISFSIASVDANNLSEVLDFAFRGPVSRTIFFFAACGSGWTD
jgi:hypothetical protein